MLVVSRRKSQSIVLTVPAGTVLSADLHIRVCAVSIQPHRARLGVEAPPCVQICRDDAIVREAPLHRYHLTRTTSQIPGASLGDGARGRGGEGERTDNYSAAERREDQVLLDAHREEREWAERIGGKNEGASGRVGEGATADISRETLADVIPDVQN